MIAKSVNRAKRSLERLKKKRKAMVHAVKASREVSKVKFSLTTSRKAKGARTREGKAAKRKTDSSGRSIQL